MTAVPSFVCPSPAAWPTSCRTVDQRSEGLAGVVSAVDHCTVELSSMSNSTSGALGPADTDQTVQVWPSVPGSKSSTNFTVFTPSRCTEVPQEPVSPVEAPVQVNAKF